MPVVREVELEPGWLQRQMDQVKAEVANWPDEVKAMRHINAGLKQSVGGSKQMITLTFPVDPRLHAHTSGSWRKKAVATKQMRTYAYLAAKQSGQTPIHGPVSVTYRFTVPNRIRRDAANMIQACKPIIDGICDAGLIDGDHWEVMRIIGVDVVVGKELAVTLEIT
jgi:hypothetical protein